jgi:hypothetical protein
LRSKKKNFSFGLSTQAFASEGGEDFVKEGEEVGEWVKLGKEDGPPEGTTERVRDGVDEGNWDWEGPTDPVGYDEGGAEGLDEGTADIDGWNDNEGCFDATSVGLLLFDGIADKLGNGEGGGAMIGRRVGPGVGQKVGCTVGLCVGLGVGWWVGSEVGLGVGSDVDEGVGNWVLLKLVGKVLRGTGDGRGVSTPVGGGLNSREATSSTICEPGLIWQLAGGKVDRWQMVSSIHCLNPVTLEYTPGWVAVAHLYPKLVMPTCFPDILSKRGPPESPQQASFPPPSIIAQIIISSGISWGRYLSWQSWGSNFDMSTFCKCSAISNGSIDVTPSPIAVTQSPVCGNVMSSMSWTGLML